MLDDVLAQTVALGGYLAIWKLIVFVVLFCAWAWVGQWMDKDAPAVKTSRNFWNNIYLLCGTTITVLWFILPARFYVVLLLFLVVWATVCVIYVMHRNARVPRNETILTRDHIKWVITSKKEGKHVERRLEFISVNDNDLPIPFKDENEYNGYVMAEEILHDVWQRRVSHARIMPVGDKYQLQIVIDGITTAGSEYDREDGEEAISYLKAVAGLDVADRRKPQEGSFFTIRTGEETTQWRICTSGSTRGEELLLDRMEEVKDLPIDEIGLYKDQLDQLLEVAGRPGGAVLISGDKESGLTTTIYSFISRHDAFTQNIHTLEMDYLVDMDNVTQHKIETGSQSPSHARQLQSVLHTDPDIIMAGFCDEKEIAQLGTKASLEGKKLYFGVNAPSLLHALVFWLKNVDSNEKIAKTLNAITNQRLIRKLCLDCREGYTPDAAMLKKLNLPVGKVKQFYRPPTEIEYDKRGEPILCETCQGTGYFGRTAVFEVLIVSDDLRKLIAAGASMEAIRTQCRKERVLYLQEQALRKVIDGTTSIKEVLRVTADKSKKTTKK